MGAYLVDHPPARAQMRCPRRARPSGVVVVHTAENTPDLVAFDGGAEAVARFIRGRRDAGSYHDLVDSDSAINLVPYDCEAFHDGTGSNSHSYGVSVATRADVWPLAPAVWRDGAVRQAAAAARRYADWLLSHHGVVVPARRISRAESERRVPGFISHAERDPRRRSDPGKAFPWDAFLTYFAGGQKGGQKEDDDMTPEQDKLLREAAANAAAAKFLAQLTWDTLTPNGFAYVEPTTGKVVPKGTAGAKPAMDVWRWSRESVEADREDDDRHAALVTLVEELRKLAGSDG